MTLVAGCNGCLVAVRLALAQPDAIERLLLAWPPSAGDPVVDDARLRGHLASLGASPGAIDDLLAGQTLRGVTDSELATLQMPVRVLRSAPENPVHQRHTIDALLRQLRWKLRMAAATLGPTREAPQPHLVGTVDRWADAFQAHPDPMTA